MGRGGCAVAQFQQEGEGQVAARGIACDRDVLRRDTVLQKPVIGGGAVIESCGKWVFGRQAVIDHQDAGVHPLRQPCSHVEVLGGQSEDEAAAMEVEECAAWWAVLGDKPVAGYAVRGYGLPRHTRFQSRVGEASPDEPVGQGEWQA